MTERIKKNRVYIITVILLCAVSVFSLYQYCRLKSLEYATELEYNRVFSELTEYVDDLEISLIKGQLVNSPRQMTQLGAELYRQAGGAKANLALLPIESQKMEKTAEFLAQVGEYAALISDKMQNGEQMSEKELETIMRLKNYATKLKTSLDELRSDINDGKISFTEEKLRAARAFSGGKRAMAVEMEDLEEEFHDYPSLIYDGPFSNHLTLRKSILVSGKAEITENAARAAAKKLFAREGEYTVTETAGKLPTYSIKCGNVSAEFTKNGGLLLMMLCDRTPDKVTIDIENAKKNAAKFLAENGFPDMRESYCEIRGGSAVINYAYFQDEYIVFPDLVKVKVALDNGEIIGFESRGYIMNHIYRDIPKEKITPEDAAACINGALSYDGVTKAIIPLENGSEACCYQIKGVVADKHYLVYVNTQTGEVEDMQILLESDGGTLAV